MKGRFVLVVLLFGSIRCLPHILVYHLGRNKRVIQADVNRWVEINEVPYSGTLALIYLLSFYPEFRNLFYHRVGFIGKFLNIICPNLSSLIISCNDIGEGLFIQHGIATVIAAKSIGKNCWINQQVTLGYSNKTDCPTLMDNVTVYGGAKVVGKVVLENNSLVGANAVVVKNVLSDCTVVGSPARIVRRNGVKVLQSL